MIPTWGTSTGRNGAGGIPSLLLDFSNQSYLLNGTGYAAFGGSPGITFSRGTNATLIDSTGQLTYAPSNMLTNSESFGATSWSKIAVSVTSNVIADPNGYLTADKLIEDTSTNYHYISGSNTVVSGTVYTISFYAKAAENNFINLQGGGTAFSSSAGVSTNLTTGQQLGYNGATVFGATNVGNGWWRIYLNITAAASASGNVVILTSKTLSSNPTYLGDGTSGAYIWGAQLGAITYETAPRAYNSTTPKNLLGFTEEFNNAAWVKTLTTVTTNSIADPNGNLNADKLIGNATASGHIIQQIGIASAVLGTPYTISIYVKAAGYNFAFVGLNGTAYSPAQYISINLTDGSFFTASGAPSSASVTDVGNGWYRVSVSGSTTVASSAVQLDARPSADGVWANRNTAQNGTDGIYVWGAQLSDSASVDPYVYNPAAALTSTAYYGPRFDYNPNYAYTAGNLIPYANPQDFSNGSFWFKPRATAPATTATVDPAGTYTAYKLTEDTTASASHLIQWQGVNTSVTAGVQYTFSGYVKLADAARPSVQVAIGNDNGAFTENIGIINLTTGVVSDPVGTAPIVTDAGNGWWRWSITATATASALCVVRTFLIAGGTNVYTGDGTSGVYIWGAQLVTGSAPVPFFYYPLNPLGLLIEEARTNLLLNSATLSTQIVTTTAQAYTLSFYGTGTVTLAGSSLAGPLVGTGLFPQRASLTFTPTAGALTLTVTGTVSNAQLEAGGFATSYIPTAGASVTRSADVATMVGNNFSNWYNQTTGTFSVTTEASANANAEYLEVCDVSNSSNSFYFDNSVGSMRNVTFSGSSAVSVLNLSAVGTVGATNKLAGVYALNDFAASRNGGTVVTDTVGAVPVGVLQMNIGRSVNAIASTYIDGHIKSISYYNTRLTDTLLQAITT